MKIKKLWEGEKRVFGLQSKRKQSNFGYQLFNKRRKMWKERIPLSVLPQKTKEEEWRRIFGHKHKIKKRQSKFLFEAFGLRKENVMKLSWQSANPRPKRDFLFYQVWPKQPKRNKMPKCIRHTLLPLTKTDQPLPQASKFQPTPPNTPQYSATSPQSLQATHFKWVYQVSLHYLLSTFHLNVETKSKEEFYLSSTSSSMPSKMKPKWGTLQLELRISPPCRWRHT